MSSGGTLPARRTTSLSGSARLSLSVSRGRTVSPPPRAAGRHPLKQDWSLSFVHRPPGAKVDYEKEIRRVATFGSIESFLQLYSHVVPPNELPAVTDVLVFVARIGRPGVWEEMRDGGKFTLRLAHPVTPLLYETLVFALLGDQFDDSEAVVGCVLSVRQMEDILSVWVEEEGEGVRSGVLKEKILTLLSLPPSTNCEYRSNKALLDAASSKPYQMPLNAQHDGFSPSAGVNEHGHGHNYSHHHTHHPPREPREGREGRNSDNRDRRVGRGERKENGWSTRE